jgi:galactokinase/mevalonate kinase-like predicted kinase
MLSPFSCYNGGIVFSSFIDAYNYIFINKFVGNDVYGLLLKGEYDINSNVNYDKVSSVSYYHLMNDVSFARVPGVV